MTTPPAAPGSAVPGLWAVGAPHPNARFWANVAAFGALWGALEITLGSFLHALRLPVAGTVLAAVSASLLVAQRQLRAQRGLSLATGLVAAVCKSVSPGGVILGPMVGITVEALVVELALIVAPRSRLAAALAGAVAVCWATFQKVISHYVYFGGSVIDLYLALLRRGAQLVGLPGEAGWQGLLGVVVVIGIGGAAVALWGRSVGIEVSRRLNREDRQRTTS